MVGRRSANRTRGHGVKNSTALSNRAGKTGSKNRLASIQSPPVAIINAICAIASMQQVRICVRFLCFHKSSAKAPQLRPAIITAKATIDWPPSIK